MTQKTDLAVFTWFGFNYSFDEIVKIIKNAGFQSVMIWWGDDYIEKDKQPKEKKPDIIRKNNIRLENVHLPIKGVNDIWIDSINGEDIINKFIKNIEECGTYEIPIAVMHISQGDNPPPYNQLGLDRLKRIIDKAEKVNVNIALENLRKPEYLDFIFNNIKSDKLGFCYDSGHENCFSPNYNCLTRFGDKLIALHLHDNDGRNDQHMLPFNGTIIWKKIMEQIKNSNYYGPLSLEIANTNNSTDIAGYTAEEYLLEAKNRTYKLIDILKGT